MQPFYVVGPTGSGKSAVAERLALATGGEIVNADAFQIYDALDILTAKPSAESRAAVPHHLFGTVPANQEWDVAAYERIAKAVIAEIAGRGALPIVVGGSGLYVKALTHGLSPTPPADEALRAELSSLPLETLVERLRTIDPESAATINLKNPRYVQRAIEITTLTGTPASVLKADWEKDTAEYRGVIVEWERETLYGRINRRTEEMFSEGAVEEVENVGALSATAAKAIGLREIRAHLNEGVSLKESIAALQQATRRYAKRQINWFNREKRFRALPATEPLDPDALVAQILQWYPDLKE